MNYITFTQETPLNSTNEIIDGIFKLRHKTFIERLDWDIPSHGGKERDQFDTLNPYHIAVTEDSKGEVKGCWRALPTVGDYMLKSTFPELLQGEEAPQEENIWEISRFAVKKGCNKEKGNFSDVSLEMVRSFYDFAQQHNIDSYVTVTTVACERLLRQLGVTLRRMGEGKVIEIGIERSVALRIEVDQSLALVKQ